VRWPAGGPAGQGLRALLLIALLVTSGVGLGLAAGYPVSRIEFEESNALRLEQSRLAGQVEPEQALVAGQDLPLTWAPGDPAVGAFGLLGLGFCGEDVALPTALSSRQVAVFKNQADQAFLISEAIRVDRWQSARSYIDDVTDSVEACGEFYRPDGSGGQVKVEIQDAAGDPPITDHVARTFVTEDGSSVQVWSIMAVGDVLIAMQHFGPQRPQRGLISDLERKILVRIDPEDFAPGGVAVTTTTVVESSSTTVLEDGAADESEPAPPPSVPASD
jgi:hypothetical protein